MPGVTQLTSTRVSRREFVTVQFDLNCGIDAAANDIQCAINAAGGQLPEATCPPRPPTGRSIRRISPVLILGARSATLPLTRINELLDSFLAQQIGQMPGVAQAQIGGDRRPAIRIQIDPVRLAALGLTLEEVRPPIVTATTAAPKGMLKTSELSFTIVPTTKF